MEVTVAVSSAFGRNGSAFSSYFQPLIPELRQPIARKSCASVCRLSGNHCVSVAINSRTCFRPLAKKPIDLSPQIENLLWPIAECPC